MNSWNDIALTFTVLARALRAEWKCDFPSESHRLTKKEEAECDGWCRKLAQDITKPMSPPAWARPWILARVATATSNARLREKCGDKVPMSLTPEIVEDLLVAVWHQEPSRMWG